jgi:hypothetical protein
MATSIEIVNDKTGSIYRFFSAEVGNLNYSINTKIFKEPLPGDNGKNAPLINLGRDITITFPFKMLDTTSTSESASGTGSVYTPSQKQHYIRETLISDGIEDLYYISIFSTNGNILNELGILENFTMDINSQNPNSINGSITITLGGGSQT